MARCFFSLGSFLAAAAVAAGAFGAHGLADRLSPRMLQVYETAVRYHMLHALGLLAVAWALDRYGGAWIRAAGWGMVAGIVLFSGSLYLLALTGRGWLGMITPIGGLAWIVSWALLGAAVLPHR